MAIDEGLIVRESLSEWAVETRAVLLNFAKTYPAVFRRGVQALLEPPSTARTRQKERTLLEQLANSDGAAFEAELEQRINATSFQEVVELLGSARSQPPR